MIWVTICGVWLIRDILGTTLSSHAWHCVSCVTKRPMRHIYHTPQNVHAWHCDACLIWSYATYLHAWHDFKRDNYMKFKVFPPTITLYKLTSKISIFTSLHLFPLPSPSFFLPTIIISSLKVMANLHLRIFYN